jgi:hypothetical protein
MPAETIMDHDDQHPDSSSAAIPVSGRFQFNLKTLMALPVLAGLCAYFYDWRVHRPPYQEVDQTNKAAFDDFVEDLKEGRLNDAYASTSPRFREQTTRRQFEALIRRHPTLRKGWIADRGSAVPAGSESMSLRRRSTHFVTLSARNKPMIELWVWVVTDDSIFHRRPPLPQVEEVQIRTTDPSKPPFCPPLYASWEE